MNANLVGIYRVFANVQLEINHHPGSQAIDGLARGMMIDFKLDVRKDTVYADQIRVHAYENTAQEPMAARQLEILDAATGPPSRTGPALLVGQTVPDFTLIDQRRKGVTVSSFKGK